eukprot:CAMPEP_0194491482 /NCGR_PEP_ID=MMETSP0253-20130528/10346_1 /TAXON_ID=2966 /ORGANISM="Noctiluca scintillans" /LENGTH=383 /DNA_ID=CAMNT_0039332225 /DNA_START=58 /DNA_END=1210 /DNA_ORIENTATION=+
MTLVSLHQNSVSEWIPNGCVLKKTFLEADDPEPFGVSAEVPRALLLQRSKTEGDEPSGGWWCDDDHSEVVDEVTQVGLAVSQTQCSQACFLNPVSMMPALVATGVAQPVVANGTISVDAEPTPFPRAPALQIFGEAGGSCEGQASGKMNTNSFVTSSSPSIPQVRWVQMWMPLFVHPVPAQSHFQAPVGQQCPCDLLPVKQTEQARRNDAFLATWEVVGAQERIHGNENRVVSPWLESCFPEAPLKATLYPSERSGGRLFKDSKGLVALDVKCDGLLRPTPCAFRFWIAGRSGRSCSRGPFLHDFGLDSAWKFPSDQEPLDLSHHEETLLVTIESQDEGVAVSTWPLASVVSQLWLQHDSRTMASCFDELLLYRVIPGLSDPF